MTKQEIFDKVVAGLASQGFKRSRNASDSMCAYRGANGLKCAVGHLIPDNAYNPKWEGLGMCGVPARETLDDQNDEFHDRRRYAILDACGVGSEHARFLGELQSAHDCGHQPENMKGRLREVAQDFDLVCPDALLPAPSE